MASPVDDVGFCVLSFPDNTAEAHRRPQIEPRLDPHLSASIRGEYQAADARRETRIPKEAVMKDLI
jgi:hypothetical protein